MGDYTPAGMDWLDEFPDEFPSFSNSSNPLFKSQTHAPFGDTLEHPPRGRMREKDACFPLKLAKIYHNHQHLDLSVSITYGPHLLGYYAPNNIPKISSKQRTLCLA